MSTTIPAARARVQLALVTGLTIVTVLIGHITTHTDPPPAAGAPMHPSAAGAAVHAGPQMPLTPARTAPADDNWTW